MNGKILTISDKVHGLIELTNLEKEVISSSLFNRLHDVYQNSTVYLTFPSNRTKRFEHSIGVMHLAGEMFFNSVYNASVLKNHKIYNSFITKAGEEIQKVFEFVKKDGIVYLSNKISMERQKLEYFENFFKAGDDEADTHNSKRVLMLGEKDKDRKLFFGIMYQAVRLAALLHDIGHPPYSHITERALYKVYNYCKSCKDNDKNPKIKDFITIYNNARGEECLQLHEAMGNKMVNKIFDKIVDGYVNGDGEISQLRALYVSVVWGCVNLILSEGKKFSDKLVCSGIDCAFWQDVHKLISGDLDCDRLDYVVRDSVSSICPGDYINYSRMISGMRLEESEGRFVFAFMAKVIDTLNEFFIKRNSLYESIIFHHRVQKTDRLLIEIIAKLAEDYFRDNDCVLKSELFPSDITGLWKAFENLDRSIDCENRLLRWDDSWLITVLKTELRKREQTKALSDRNKQLIAMLKEILQNEKNYFSVIKRGYDFEVVDKSFSDKMRSLLESLKIDGKDEFSECVNEYREFLKNDRHIKFKGFGSKIFALQFFHNFLYKHVFENAEEFEKLITDCIRQGKKNYNARHGGNKIEDIFVSVKKTKSANNSIKLYRPYREGELFAYTDESNIVNIIDLFKYDLPLFYIYIKKQNPKSEPIEAGELLENAGKKIAEKFFDKISGKLNESNNGVCGNN